MRIFLSCSTSSKLCLLRVCFPFENWYFFPSQACFENLSGLFFFCTEHVSFPRLRRCQRSRLTGEEKKRPQGHPSSAAGGGDLASPSLLPFTSFAPLPDPATTTGMAASAPQAPADTNAPGSCGAFHEGDPPFRLRPCTQPRHGLLSGRRHRDGCHRCTHNALGLGFLLSVS